MNGNRQTPTPPPQPGSNRIVDLIEAIEPPPHRPDFWDRLDESVARDDGRSDRENVTSLSPRSTTTTRIRVWALTAAAVAAVALVGRSIRPEPTVDVSSDDTPVPQESIGSGTASTMIVTVPTTEQTAPPTTVSPTASTTAAPTSTSTATVDPSTTVSVPSSSTTTSTASTGPSTTTTSAAPTAATSARAVPVPVDGAADSPRRIEAETMETRSVGQATFEGWNLFSAGHLEQPIQVPTGGTLLISVEARGTRRGTLTAPEMTVSVDGREVGVVSVPSSGYRTYTFEAPVVSGSHRLRIAFTNDPATPEADLDLTVDYVDVAVAP